MTDEEINKIRRQKNFCVLPFSHLFMQSSGDVWPCARTTDDREYLVGNTSQSIEELWNSEPIKKLRVKILNNECISVCDKECHDITRSLRQSIHGHIEYKSFDHCKETIRNTKSDGSCDVNFIIWQLVESNRCNFKCLYCTKSRSSNWNKDEAALTKTKIEDKVKIAYQSFDRLKQEYSKYINTVKYLYFCAGESTFQDSYYWMLDELIRLKRTDEVTLFFITNLSSRIHKSRNMYELLDQFKTVEVAASLDAMGSRAEYIRCGTKWDIIERNREELLKYKNINFVANPTMTNMNMYHFPDFHMDWYNKGFMKKDNIRYNILIVPEYFGIDVLPVKLKEEIIEKYDIYKKWIQSDDNLNTYSNKISPIEKINQILSIMNSNQNEDLIKQFTQYIDKMDNIRNNSFWKTFYYESSFFK